jgi:hypothetical protein
MATPGAGRAAQVAAVALLAVLLGFQVVRGAAVADRDAHPVPAATLWPSHPSLLTERALLSIASAASHGKPVPAPTRAVVRHVAAKAPLSPDPFLIEGAIAETEQRSAASERLLLAALSRDPRSRGTRFLLAERYFRTGRITAALIEMQALIRIQARGFEVFVPALVGYARTPGAVPELRAFFTQYPGIESLVLSSLSADPANVDLILALATVPRPEPDWRITLVSALASAGQYPKAYATWARLSGVRSRPALFNPGFAELSAPPPFNWAFPQTAEGVAEPNGKGGVQILYYGRAKAVLVSQLLVLPPGQYRLEMGIADASGEEGAIHWGLRCANADKTLADMPLRAGAAGFGFAVPADCPAQWLELMGVAGDMPQTTELTISNLRLTGGTGR